MKDLLLVSKALRLLADQTTDSEEKKQCLELARSLEAQVIGGILDSTALLEDDPDFYEQLPPGR